MITHAELSAAVHPVAPHGDEFRELFCRIFLPKLTPQKYNGIQRHIYKYPWFSPLQILTIFRTQSLRNVGSAQNTIFMCTVFDSNLCDTGPPSLRRQSPQKNVEEERGGYTPKTKPQRCHQATRRAEGLQNKVNNPWSGPSPRCKGMGTVIHVMI